MKGIRLLKKKTIANVPGASSGPRKEVSENPTTMFQVRALSFKESIDYNFRMEHCGGNEVR